MGVVVEVVGVLIVLSNQEPTLTGVQALLTVGVPVFDKLNRDALGLVRSPISSDVECFEPKGAALDVCWKIVFLPTVDDYECVWVGELYCDSCQLGV